MFGDNTVPTDKLQLTAANQFLASIHQFNFQMSMMILVKLFWISVSSSKFLHTKKLYLENALYFAEITQTTLKDIRSNADKEFHEIFKSVEKICNTLNIVVCVPRYLVGKDMEVM